jgi:hypothetical protein
MIPQDWHILVGLPTTVEEWKKCTLDPSKFDYFRQAHGSQKAFESRFGQPPRRLLRQLKRLGCSVCQCSLDNLSAMFNGAKAVTLIAHWDQQDRIELFDGLHDWQSLVAVIPKDYGGIIDLCVCHPLPMVRYLDVYHRRALVKCKLEGQSDIVLWLGVYCVMAAKMAKQPTKFTDALLFAKEKLDPPKQIV